MGRIRKLLSYIRSGQWGKVARGIADLFSLSVFKSRKAFIFILDKRKVVENTRADIFPDGFSGRIATRDEMLGYAEMAGVKPEVYLRRFDAGDTGYAVFAEDKVVNLTWIHSGSCYIRGMGYHHHGELSDKYIYDGLTVPSARRRGLFRVALQAVVVHFLELGKCRVIAMVEDGNAPVLHTLPMLGYTMSRTILHIVILGVKYTRTVNLDNRRISHNLFLKAPRETYVV